MWSKTTPHVNGWYWLKYPGVMPYVAHVWIDKGVLNVRGLPFTNDQAKWAGPLIEPTQEWGG